MLRGRSNAKAAGPMPQTPPPRSLYVRYGLLLAILLVAGGLRIAYLTQVPPGLNQDEAANAWNAWCLLKTGHDQVGAGWPVFYFRALGENRSTLFMYLMLPFQAVGGLNVWTTRLPSATCGLAAIILLYWVVARLFDRTTGLVAAALLALAPWHIVLSRWGHEAAWAPVATCAALAALLWAGFPLRDGPTRPVIWRALVAGLIAGAVCYGYASIRLFLPVFLVACVLISARSWGQLLRTRRGAAALGACALGVATTFGPLLYQHLAHPEGIAKRGQMTTAFGPPDTLAERSAKVAGRYVLHFDPRFLFAPGEHWELHAPRGFGAYAWYALPLMLIGLVVLVRNMRASRAARIALCGVLLYPLGDCLHFHYYWDAAEHVMRSEANTLRSAPGLAMLCILAAVGGATAGRALWRKNRRVGTAAFALCAVAVLGLDARFLTYYFREHSQCRVVYREYQAGLVEAFRWLRPHLADTDAVWVSAAYTNAPWIVGLVTLGYDPQQWFRDERERREIEGWDTYTRVGKLHFVYSAQSATWLQELRDSGRSARLVFILRPSEAWQMPPAHVVRDPDGMPRWLIYMIEQ